MKPVLCIAGPTASGKSAWAVSLAKKYNGEIINADAMQVYSDLHIISARPTEAETDGIAHHMFGHVDGRIRYSTGHWLRDVQSVILEVLARGKMPILVGGTGLYFKALTEGLAQVPSPDVSVLQEVQSLLETDGIAALRLEAERLDPVATQRVLGADPQRLLRIVSVALGTARPLSEWQAETHPVIPKGYWVGVKLLPDRAALYARINARFDTMVSRGGMDEVAALVERGLSGALPVMKAIGVPQLTPSLEDDSKVEAALELSKRDTRRFAKRQFTWLRGNMAEWFSVAEESDKIRFETVLAQKVERF